MHTTIRRTAGTFLASVVLAASGVAVAAPAQAHIVLGKWSPKSETPVRVGFPPNGAVVARGITEVKGRVSGVLFHTDCELQILEETERGLRWRVVEVGTHGTTRRALGKSCTIVSDIQYGTKYRLRTRTMSKHTESHKGDSAMTKWSYSKALVVRPA